MASEPPSANVRTLAAYSFCAAAGNAATDAAIASAATAFQPRSPILPPNPSLLPGTICLESYRLPGGQTTRPRPVDQPGYQREPKGHRRQRRQEERAGLVSEGDRL